MQEGVDAGRGAACEIDVRLVGGEAIAPWQLGGTAVSGLESEKVLKALAELTLEEVGNGLSDCRNTITGAVSSDRADLAQ
jgi:hypothetical protein